MGGRKEKEGRGEQGRKEMRNKGREGREKGEEIRKGRMEKKKKEPDKGE